MRAVYAIPVLSALLAMGSVARATDPTDSLQRRLRAQRPDVSRWQISPIGSAQPAAAAEIAAVGRIAPRTAVRFADGRVRWYAVAGFRSVLVSKVPLERGAAVNPQATDLAEHDVIGLACEPVVADALPGLRTTRRLAAGDALCAGALEPAPEVQREHRVTLNARQGAVSVSRPLTATTDARLGERVRLRDRATGATVIAVVTGPGEARLAQELR
jgi:flagella basal body P-ring formation protein FlgA